MKKYIVSVASCLFALCMQSCFQDMDHPAFDYPESTGEVPTTPLKMYLPFDEEDIRDKGEWGYTRWGFISTVTKEIPINYKAKRVSLTFSNSEIDEATLIYGIAMLYKQKRPRGNREGVTERAIVYDSD